MIIKPRNAKRLAVLGATAALAAGLGTASASATVTPNASGGGCSSYENSGVNNIYIESCISSNGTMYPDGYLSGNLSNCTATIDLWHNGVIVNHTTDQCSDGHVNGIPTLAAGTYQTGIYVTVNQQQSYEIFSPQLVN